MGTSPFHSPGSVESFRLFVDMSFTLGDALKARERERASKAGDLKKSAEAYAAVLKEQELQRKRNAHAQEQERLAEQNLEILRERERKRIEDERKTKRYFQVDKYGRKVPVENAPVYFGDMIEKFDAWLPHGKGQFSLNETIIMKGDFNQGDFTGGEVKWSDGTYWEGKLVDHKMHGVGVITLADGVKKEAMMRANALVCYKEGIHALQFMCLFACRIPFSPMLILLFDYPMSSLHPRIAQRKAD